jgi:undecaprenyl-diphosphatase
MAFIEQLNNWDHQFFLFLNGFHNSFFDYLMTVFTAEVFWVPFYVIIGFVMARKYGKKSILIFVSIGILILCTDQFAGIFKHSIQRLRPSHDPVMSQLTHIFHYKGGLYSFYSAHSANAFAFATFTVLLFRNKAYTWFILPWALLVAYTRIYLGLHYPGDILCGAISGVVIAFGVYRLMILSERRLYPADRVTNTFLNNKEVSIIEISALLMVIIAMLIINLLIRNQLVISG